MENTFSFWPTYEDPQMFSLVNTVYLRGYYQATLLSGAHTISDEWYSG